jgi:GPH family glycoside/pentoside/hexuronide:cation symporter
MANTEDIIAPIGPKGDNHAARGGKLRFGTLTAYGSGMLVHDTLGIGLSSLLLFYLTLFCGLSGTEAGIIIGLTLVADAFVDPLAGSLSDNSRSRHGRRHPFMLMSAVPIAIAYGLLFSAPQGLTGPLMFLYALTMLMVVRVGLSFFQVPYIALGAELSDDYTERSTVVASRVIWTVIAGLGTAVLTYGVFLGGQGGQLNRAGYAPLAWTCAVLVLIGAAFSSFGTLNMRDRLHAPPQGGGAPLGRLLAEVIEVFRNRSFCILFGACLILFTGLGVAGGLSLYANTSFWRLEPAAILLVTLAASFGYLGGVFVATAMTQRFEKRTVAVFGIALIGVSQLVPAGLRLIEAVPQSGALALLFVGSVAGGIGGACALIGFQSMMADAADEHEHLFGARREGLYFAGISLSAKASSGIGSLIAGILLDLIRYPHGHGVTAQQLAHVPLATVNELGILSGPGAALITAVSVVTLTLYRRGRKDHEEIRQALLERRGMAAAAE